MGHVRDHPRYNHDNEKTKLFYDISILTMVNKLKFSSRVMPVCLPSMRRVEMYDRRLAQTMGWGLVSARLTARKLMVVNVTTTTQKNCDNSGWTNINSR